MKRQVLVDAEVLERLLNEATYGNDQNTRCMACYVPEPRHAPDCPVPVLQAALAQPTPAPAEALRRKQLQAVLDAPRWDELTPAERTDVIARHVASSLRLSGYETTPEQIKGHLASARRGTHVISLEHNEASSQRGMREAAERVARSVLSRKEEEEND